MTQNDTNMVMDRSEREHLALFAYLDGMGPVKIRRLIEVFGSAERAWHNFGAPWLSVPGIGDRLLARWQQAHRSIGRDQLTRNLERHGILCLTADDFHYPAIGRAVEELPVILFVAGDSSVLSQPAVTVVGTRACTPYGQRVARLLGSDLASSGVTVVSGLAYGIDGAAHQGAVGVEGGRSVAVFPCGLDYIYPRDHRRLAWRIRRRGAWVSEYPPGIGPQAGRFRARNRIMAALGQGVVVVEAGLRSGAMITVGKALEYGRAVMAVPGLAGAAASAGCHQLIRDGASLVESAADIRAVVGWRPDDGSEVPGADGVRVDTGAAAPAGGSAVALTPDEALLYALFDAPEVDRESLMQRSGLAAHRISAALVRLELRGLIERMGMGSGTFSRVR